VLELVVNFGTSIESNAASRADRSPAGGTSCGRYPTPPPPPAAATANLCLQLSV